MLLLISVHSDMPHLPFFCILPKQSRRLSALQFAQWF